MRFRSDSQRKAIFARMAAGGAVGAAAGYGAIRGARKGIRKTRSALMRGIDSSIAKEGVEGAMKTRVGGGVARGLLPVMYAGLKKKKTVAGAIAVGAGVGAIVTARHGRKRDQKVRITMGPKTRASFEKMAEAMAQGRTFAQGMKGGKRAVRPSI